MQRVRADYEIWTQQTIVQAIKRLRMATGSEHYKGYYEKQIVFATLQGDQGDYAYCAETETIWIYTADGVWINSSINTPNQVTPKSNLIPLQDEEQGNAGNVFSYSAGDHVHPISLWVKDKIYQLFEEKLDKIDLPTTLPNPESLRLNIIDQNGIRQIEYNGSVEKQITLYIPQLYSIEEILNEIVQPLPAEIVPLQDEIEGRIGGLDNGLRQYFANFDHVHPISSLVTGYQQGYTTTNLSTLEINKMDKVDLPTHLPNPKRLTLNINDDLTYYDGSSEQTAIIKASTLDVPRNDQFQLEQQTNIQRYQNLLIEINKLYNMFQDGKTAYVFDTTEEMNNALLDELFTVTLKIEDQFYIREILYIFWWDGLTAIPLGEQITVNLDNYYNKDEINVLVNQGMKIREANLDDYIDEEGIINQEQRGESVGVKQDGNAYTSIVYVREKINTTSNENNEPNEQENESETGSDVYMQTVLLIKGQEFAKQSDFKDITGIIGGLTGTVSALKSGVDLIQQGYQAVKSAQYAIDAGLGVTGAATAAAAAVAAGNTAAIVKLNSDIQALKAATAVSGAGKTFKDVLDSLFGNDDPSNPTSGLENRVSKLETAKDDHENRLKELEKEEEEEENKFVTTTEENQQIQGQKTWEKGLYVGNYQGNYVGPAEDKNALELSPYNGEIVLAGANGGTMFINSGKSALMGRILSKRFQFNCGDKKTYADILCGRLLSKYVTVDCEYGGTRGAIDLRTHTINTNSQITIYDSLIFASYTRDTTAQSTKNQFRINPARGMTIQGKETYIPQRLIFNAGSKTEYCDIRVDEVINSSLIMNNQTMTIKPNLLDSHSASIITGQHLNILLNQSSINDRLIINGNISVSELSSNPNSDNAKQRAKVVEYHGDLIVSEILKTDVFVVSVSPQRDDVSPALAIIGDQYNIHHITLSRKNRLNIEFESNISRNLYINSESPFEGNQLPLDIYIFAEPMGSSSETKLANLHVGTLFCKNLANEGEHAANVTARNFNATSMEFKATSRAFKLLAEQQQEQQQLKKTRSLSGQGNKQRHKVYDMIENILNSRKRRKRPRNSVRIPRQSKKTTNEQKIIKTRDFVSQSVITRDFNDPPTDPPTNPPTDPNTDAPEYPEEPSDPSDPENEFPDSDSNETIDQDNINSEDTDNDSIAELSDNIPDDILNPKPTGYITNDNPSDTFEICSADTTVLITISEAEDDHNELHINSELTSEGRAIPEKIYFHAGPYETVMDNGTSQYVGSMAQLHAGTMYSNNQQVATVDMLENIGGGGSGTGSTQPKSYVFDTQNDLDEWMQITDNVDLLNVGDKMYISNETFFYWWEGETLQQIQLGGSGSGGTGSISIGEIVGSGNAVTSLSMNGNEIIPYRNNTFVDLASTQTITGTMTFSSDVTANSFAISGENGTDQYVLLADGSTKSISDFANSSTAYLPLTGGTVTGSITAASFVKSSGTNGQLLLADGTTKNVSDFALNGSGPTTQFLQRISLSGMSNIGYISLARFNFVSTGYVSIVAQINVIGYEENQTITDQVTVKFRRETNNTYSTTYNKILVRYDDSQKCDYGVIVLNSTTALLFVIYMNDNIKFYTKLAFGSQDLTTTSIELLNSEQCQTLSSMNIPDGIFVFFSPM
ncbi:MAG: hypothetical protein EZS28_023256 [Streblomastix strix]|uniref:Uncharacterized protein n=1 Tax=Streblomastix strix TaxID=222440 RepID=A0A5J4VF79_9EUKA|nr:MAG: hypothetical protein EZS28_023256 [Streblomastix strix]